MFIRLSPTPALGRLILLAALAPAAPADPLEVCRLESWLVVPKVAGGGRSPLRTDPVEYQIVMGTWKPPAAGDMVTLGEGETRTWAGATPNAEGWIEDEGLVGGYAFATARCEAATIAILDAAGHSMVYVNGEPRMGDPYAYGYLQLPVELRAGENTFLFRVDRGRVRARLVAPKADVFLNVADPTLPDQVVGESGKLLGAVVVVNATREAIPAGKFRVRTDFAGGTAETELPGMLPLTIRKVPVNIVARPDLPPGETSLKLELLAPDGAALDAADLEMRVADKYDWRRITFTSTIDDSVQYYAMWPPAPGGAPNQLPGLIFTVHGASVEATGQIRAYTPKPWAYIVAPTNRRPYGFDWEDWGRLDALEVWDHFLARHKTDELRRWLTGHSMGGHGTWQLGGHFPDRFAAIAPCAGWVSFFSYANQKEFHPVQGDSKIAELLRRATNPSDTLGLSNNWKQYGVYVLHGDADDNVPVTEARTMRERLGQFHTDFCYYEKPGGGHWWDNSAVDWSPLMEFIRARTRKPGNEVREIDFTTMSPSVSPRSDWITIVEQETVLAPSRVRIRYDPEKRRFEGVTDNVAGLLIATAPPDIRLGWPSVALAPDAGATVELDGQSLEIPADAKSSSGLIGLWRSDGRWRACGKQPDNACRYTVRPHAFKSAFGPHMRLIYGTAGSPEENAWSLAKARFDAEQWYYRGNGAVDVLADRELNLGRVRGASFVLYGHRDSNLAVRQLAPHSPLVVSRGAVRIGERSWNGPQHACLGIHVRDDEGVLAALVAPTGPVGMRLCDRLPYFVSGVAYPDITVLSPEVLLKGLPGVVAAGFLGNDGTVESGEFGFAE